MEDLRWPEGLGSSVSDGCLAQLSKGPAEAALSAWLVSNGGSRRNKAWVSLFVSPPWLVCGPAF